MFTSIQIREAKRSSFKRGYRCSSAGNMFKLIGYMLIASPFIVLIIGFIVFAVQMR
jgi:hypothetical protein